MTSDEMFAEAYKLRRKEKCKRLHDDMETMLKELAEADFAYSEAFDIAKHAFKNQIEELGREYLR